METQMPKEGQQRGTPKRRAIFLEHLRAFGEGDECVYWPWSDLRGQYISIHVDGQLVRAHRWVYEQVNGVTLPKNEGYGPGEHVVMHTCDNPACVRPSHLVLGSPWDNIHDAVVKRRMRPRVADGVRTKLSLQQVAQIRVLADEGVMLTAIARAFGVSASTIGDIARRRTRMGVPHQKLSDDDVAEIRRLAAVPGTRQTHLARAYGVSDATISLIVNGKKRTKPTE